MATRTNREFLMLSKDFNPEIHRVGGMYYSEKLDGMRAIWIPAARGIPVNLLPFTNTEKDKKIPLATGLFSRYGKTIYAPDWFLDKLPPFPVDGELYVGRQEFNETMSIVKQHTPDDRWRNIRYKIFDAPTYALIFETGRINNPQFKKTFDAAAIRESFHYKDVRDYGNFEFTHSFLIKQSQGWDASVIQMHELDMLPWYTASALETLEKRLAEITDDGGEGIVLRHPSAIWEPLRSPYSLKVKYSKDGEARVVGYKMGFGKHEGRLGSLCCHLLNGIHFDISGFTDVEREISGAESLAPGTVTDTAISTHFPLGSIVTFTYRELTPNGVPKEARYLRKYVKE